MSKIFITGGKSQGKTEYAKTYEAQGYHMIDDIYEEVRKRVLKEAAFRSETGGIPVSEADRMAAAIMTELDEVGSGHDNIVLIGTEIGCGIVPVDKTQRLLREVNGRLNCLLAASADKVILMNCGIAQIIKG